MIWIWINQYIYMFFFSSIYMYLLIRLYLKIGLAWAFTGLGICSFSCLLFLIILFMVGLVAKPLAHLRVWNLHPFLLLFQKASVWKICPGWWCSLRVPLFPLSNSLLLSLSLHLSLSPFPFSPFGRPWHLDVMVFERRAFGGAQTRCGVPVSQGSSQTGLVMAHEWQTVSRTRSGEVTDLREIAWSIAITYLFTLKLSPPTATTAAPTLPSLFPHPFAISSSFYSLSPRFHSATVCFQTSLGTRVQYLAEFWFFVLFAAPFSSHLLPGLLVWRSSIATEPLSVSSSPGSKPTPAYLGFSLLQQSKVWLSETKKTSFHLMKVMLRREKDQLFECPPLSQKRCPVCPISCLLIEGFFCWSPLVTLSSL